MSSGAASGASSGLSSWASLRILLMGNPNVGKSIFFTELTGIHAMSSNYAGTTVSFMEGGLNVAGKEYTLIDVPGTYSLVPTSEAETVAAEFAKGGAAAVICVLDASNLERNLLLALELRAYNIPTVYALNLTDVAKRHGISINAAVLAAELGAVGGCGSVTSATPATPVAPVAPVAPVIETVAVKGIGFEELTAALEKVLDAGEERRDTACRVRELPRLRSDMARSDMARHVPTDALPHTCGNCSGCSRTESGEHAADQSDDLWLAAKEIARRCTSKNDADLSFLDRLGEQIIRPMPGIPVAVLVMALTIGVVMGGGRLLRAVLLLPLVNNLIVPFFRNLFGSILPEGMLLNILIGEFGVFVISFEWILALIFPYVLMFYVAFTFLEDTGYLPRISILFDNIMRKLGVQGGSLLHIVMGYGCAVPAIIGSRAATSRKERIVISAAICMGVPCIAQTGAIISLMAGFNWWMMPAMFAFSLLVLIVTLQVAGRFVRGTVDPLLLEVPNLLVPNPKVYGRKLLTRMRHFLKDAEVPMLVAIVIAAVLSESGLLNLIAVYARPIVSTWLGLPAEAVTALILGIVRREMTVMPLLALDLDPLQTFVGGAVSLLYLPCLSAFAILVKEFKVRVAVTIALSTIIVAIFVGGVINHTVRFFL